MSRTSCATAGNIMKFSIGGAMHLSSAPAQRNDQHGSWEPTKEPPDTLGKCRHGSKFLARKRYGISDRWWMEQRVRLSNVQVVASSKCLQITCGSERSTRSSLVTRLFCLSRIRGPPATLGICGSVYPEPAATAPLGPEHLNNKPGSP